MNKEKSSFDFDRFSEEVTQAIREGKPLLGAEGAFTPLLKNLLEKALEGEINAHLENENNQPIIDLKNRRNGKLSKTVRSSLGAFELQTPRDRNGTFDPQVVKKRQTVLTHELDSKIIRLFSSGMSYSDISKSIK